LNIFLLLLSISMFPAPASSQTSDPAVELESEQARLALDANRVEETVKLCEEILAKDPKNELAHLRIGLARYRQGRYADAAAALEKALAEEASGDLRKAIRLDLEVVRHVTATKAAKAEPAAAKPAEEPALPVPKPAIIEKWYEEGLEAYARGDLDAASAVFLRMLVADPGNPEAAKALDRIEADRKSALPR
jgi:tetratricopeptide (TPR) repeat protein